MADAPSVRADETGVVAPVDDALPAVAVRVPPGGLRGVWRRLRRNTGAVAGLGIVLVYVAIALLADVIAPYDPDHGVLLDRLALPSPEHLLGADELGRDILSRVIVGARVSLVIQVAASALAMVIGVAWGLVSGYLGGWFDEISMRVIDVMLAFPGVLLAIAIVAVLGVGLGNMILAVAISSIPTFARLVRGVVLGTRELEYIEAARAIGEPGPDIVLRYLLPAATGPIIVQTSLRMATVLLAASSLNFLGLGVQPPTAEWGSMLSNARSYMFIAPHVAAIPGIAITAVVLGFNLLGDGLRDALDPRLR
jgi:peptide/nickel transport system permease protein